MPRFMPEFDWEHDGRCEAWDPDTEQERPGPCDCRDRAQAAWDREVDRRVDEERDREFMED